MDKNDVIITFKKYGSCYLNLGKIGFTGTLKSEGVTSFMLIDKFNEEVPIEYDSVKYMQRDRSKEGNKNGRERKG